MAGTGGPPFSAGPDTRGVISHPGLITSRGQEATRPPGDPARKVPAGGNSQSCLYSSNSAGARLKEKLCETYIPFVKHTKHYGLVSVVTSDDVDHGAGQVGVGGAAGVLPAVRVAHLR